MLRRARMLGRKSGVDRMRKDRIRREMMGEELEEGQKGGGCDEEGQY
jgi:predicted kinase